MTMNMFSFGKTAQTLFDESKAALAAGDDRRALAKLDAVAKKLERKPDDALLVARTHALRGQALDALGFGDESRRALALALTQLWPSGALTEEFAAAVARLRQRECISEDEGDVAVVARAFEIMAEAAVNARDSRAVIDAVEGAVSALVAQLGPNNPRQTPLFGRIAQVSAAAAPNELADVVERLVETAERVSERTGMDAETRVDLQEALGVVRLACDDVAGAVRAWSDALDLLEHLDVGDTREAQLREDIAALTGVPGAGASSERMNSALNGDHSVTSVVSVDEKVRRREDAREAPRTAGSGDTRRHGGSRSHLV
jgi:hypothetical protein